MSRTKGESGKQYRISKYKLEIRGRIIQSKESDVPDNTEDNNRTLERIHIFFRLERLHRTGTCPIKGLTERTDEGRESAYIFYNRCRPGHNGWLGTLACHY